MNQLWQTTTRIGCDEQRYAKEETQAKIGYRRLTNTAESRIWQGRYPFFTRNLNTKVVSL